jgi:hypothetical protein
MGGPPAARDQGFTNNGGHDVGMFEQTIGAK